MSASRRAKQLESAHRSNLLSNWMFGLSIGCIGFGVFGMLTWENVHPAWAGQARLSGASVGFPTISPYLFGVGAFLFIAALAVRWRSSRLEADLHSEEIDGDRDGRA